jgi:RNA polymerase sigma-70 factor (ECF subfamily)
MASPGGAESSGGQEIAALIAQYRADAFRVARRLVHSEAEAEDLAQTAMLNALRRAEHIEDTSHVKAYLLAAVRNLWRNQLRQQGRRRLVGADAAEHLAAGDIGPEEQALTALDVAVARLAIDALSETSRQILLLRYVEGLGFAELADGLGITTVAARQRAHRARDELIAACIEHTATTGAGSCREMRSRFGRYLRGRLSRKTRAQISAHLSRCTSCRDCYQQLSDLYGHRLSTEETE